MKDISVLVVDDEPSVALALKMRLKRSFRDVFLASDGMAGLELAISQKPDVIISDLRMPKMNGLDMIAEIRKTLPDVPIIVLTASMDKLEEQRAKELNAVGYFTKPLMVSDLVERIKELV